MWLAWATVPVPGPIGALTVGTTEAGVALVCFGAGADSRRRVIGAAQRLGAEAVSDPARTEHAAAELAEYVAGRRTRFTLPVDWRLTSGDQRTVLTTLHESVGYGQTTTYGELARELGDPTLARAVGGAVGHNPLSVIVPCHRVVGSTGALTGYGGGLDRKEWLLRHERGAE